MCELQNKEISAIFYYTEFSIWKKRLPFDLNIPDNQLTYIIFDALLKSKTNGITLTSALLNSIQFTDLVENFWYRSKRDTIIQWLIQGTMIYFPYVEILIKEFAEISCIFTDTVKERHYIKVNICGRKKLNYGKENISRIPSDDGIPEAVCRNITFNY